MHATQPRMQFSFEGFSHDGLAIDSPDTEHDIVHAVFAEDDYEDTDEHLVREDVFDRTAQAMHLMAIAPQLLAWLERTLPSIETLAEEDSEYGADAVIGRNLLSGARARYDSTEARRVRDADPKLTSLYEEGTA